MSEVNSSEILHKPDARFRTRIQHERALAGIPAALSGNAQMNGVGLEHLRGPES